jgi:uncharacterized protein
MTPDVNLLVAAARSDHTHHSIASTWLAKTLRAASAGSPLVLMPMVVASCLRLLTSPKIFKLPSGIDDAIAFIDAVLDQPGVQLAGLGPEWSALRQLCLDKQLSGNQLPDAWLAAATLQAGEHLVTFDTDFKKLLPRTQLTVLSATAI